MNYCVIATTKSQIWAINPDSRQLLRITPADKTPILDSYASDKGIHHAVYRPEPNTQRRLKGSEQVSWKQKVIIYDTLSSRPISTATGPIRFTTYLPNNPDFEFKFMKEENSLLYRLGDKKGIIFPSLTGEFNQSMLETDGKRVIFNNRKIATLDQEVQKTWAIEMEEFSRMFRIKNRARFRKNKDFFN